MSAPLRLQLSMGAAMAIGLAYVVWLAWAEGWRLWVVLGVMALVGAIGGAVHLAMGLARQRDGLEAVERNAPAVDESSSDRGETVPDEPGGTP